MTGSTSKRSLPTCTGFYGTEIKIQYNTIQYWFCGRSKTSSAIGPCSFATVKGPRRCYSYPLRWRMSQNSFSFPPRVVMVAQDIVSIKKRKRKWVAGMFISLLIPVELYSTASDIWHNPCPSSVRYYGPIIQYAKNHCFASERNLIYIRPNKGTPTHK